MKVVLQNYQYQNFYNNKVEHPSFQAKSGKLSKFIANEKKISAAYAAIGAAILSLGIGKKEQKAVVEASLENESLLRCKCLFDDFLIENPDVDKNDFYNYVNKIDLENLKKIAPLVCQYTIRELGFFITSHYLLGTKEFTKESLILQKDLTELVSETPFEDFELYDILKLFPNTDRQVGQIPEEWLDKTTLEREEAIKSLREIFDNFICADRLDLYMLEESERKLLKNISDVLNKKVELKFLGCGVSAYAYKISVEGSSPVVLKRFITETARNNVEGQWAEIPRAFFLEKRFSDKFVRAYFGRVPNPAILADGCGYLVTEFVDESINPVVRSKIVDKKYKIQCYDVLNGHNTAQGKIYDHGYIDIKLRRWFNRGFDLIKFIKKIQMEKD